MTIKKVAQSSVYIREKGNVHTVDGPTKKFFVGG
jgi:hypothetical protein